MANKANKINESEKIFLQLTYVRSAKTGPQKTASNKLTKLLADKVCLEFVASLIEAAESVRDRA